MKNNNITNKSGAFASLFNIIKGINIDKRNIYAYNKTVLSCHKANRFEVKK